MVNDDTFRERLADAYEHLYDIPSLRSHALLDLVPAGTDSKMRAWQLHQLLLKTIGEIAPGAQAPPHSKEWRRHRLMQLRYVECMPVQNAADELAISRRQFYRVHDEAIGAVADMLLNAVLPPAQVQPPDRLELLRSEAARVTRRAFASPAEIAYKAIEVLEPVCSQRSVSISVENLPQTLVFTVDAVLLRQLLLALLDYLIERVSHTTISLAVPQHSGSGLSIRVAAGISDVDIERISVFEDMADVCGVVLDAVHEGPRLIGFDVQMPDAVAARAVLVLDDNIDMLELYDRYLSPLGFSICLASTPEQAYAYLERTAPIAIFLDVMMPVQDGWDVMQRLLHHPESRQVPIVICSVLQQRELALSLGAAAFIQKPFSQKTLLSTLQQLI
jgi:CheY-like chemotaxis protein